MSKPPPKKEDPGAPAWVMTFADLMSLLMCFFVLLLSFSEMDLSKYKQVAGSMKDAFGVQREIKVFDSPKGTSIVAREFSPGKPSPTVLKIMRQNSVDDSKQTLAFTDALTTTKDGEDMEEGEGGSGSNNAPIQNREITKSIMDLIDEKMNKKFKALTASEKKEIIKKIAKAYNIDEKKAEALLNRQLPNRQTVADTKKLLKALKNEIEKGIVQIESEGKRILVRIREKGSFHSGSDQLQADFLPVIAKLREALATMKGNVRVAGHTDNLPINTARFRSNWDLSAARAVTVVHELLNNSTLRKSRFLVEGHGDAHPLVPNDSWQNRALNRRVELTIVHGEKYRGLEDEDEDDSAAEALSEVANLENDRTGEASVEVITDIDPYDSSDEDDSAEMMANIEDDDNAENNVETKTTESEASQEAAEEETDPRALNLKALEERIKRFSSKMGKHK